MVGGKIIRTYGLLHSPMDYYLARKLPYYITQ